MILIHSWGLGSAIQPESARPGHAVRGYLLIAGATLCWGVSAAVGKAVFSGRLLGGEAARIDPLILSQTRTTLAFLLLLPVVVAARGRRLLAFRFVDWLKCLLVGFAGISGSNFFYYVAIQRTTVALGITLQYFAPILVLFYMLARHRQRPTAGRVLGVVLAVAGSALAIGLLGERWRLDAIGVAAGLASAVAFSFYTVLGRSLIATYDRWAVFLYALLGSALCWSVINPPWKILAAHYTAAQWEFLLAFAVVSVGLGYSLYFAGLQYLDPTRAIVTSCLEAVFAIVIAAVYPGERPTWLQLLGIATVLFATVLVQLPGRAERAEAASEEMGLPGG